jgi:hypothetical protein
VVLWLNSIVRALALFFDPERAVMFTKKESAK